MRQQLFARTIRGIEWIAAAEISAIGDVTGFGHREVHFTAEPARTLLELGTVDDLFVTCARVPDIGHERAALATIEEAGAALDLDGPLAARAIVSRPEPRDFEVVASFLGRRNYNRFDIEDAIARGIGARRTWRARSRREGAAVTGADLTIRVHIRDGEALIGVRLGKTPMHRRAWKTESPPGSLHPPVARALVMLANAGTIHDPFCGAGTIPIEAARFGARAFGSDIDERAIGMAARNAARAQVHAAFAVADALRAPFGDVDAVVTNVPWGRDARLRGEPKDLVDLLTRAQAVVLADEALFEGELMQSISLFGAHPTIVAKSLPDDLAAWRARAADAGLV